MTIDDLLSVRVNSSDQCPGCGYLYPVSGDQIERDPSKATARRCAHAGCEHEGALVIAPHEWRDRAMAVLRTLKAAALPAEETIEISRDPHVVQRTGAGAERWTHVRDEEGDPWFSLPGDASAETIQEVARIWKRASDRGEAWGRVKLQGEMRDLLGAAPLPRDEE